MRSYEELTGAEGREIFYRAERFRPKDIFSSHAPQVDLDGERAALKDISMTGLAVQSAQLDRWDTSVGVEIPIRLCMGDAAIFAGAGRVRRVEPNGVRTTVALEFTQGYLDIQTLRTEHEALLISLALANPVFATPQFILPEYQQLSSEILYLFRSYRDLLAKFEKDLTATGRTREALLRDVLQHCEDRIVPQWQELWYRGNDIIWPVMDDPKTVAAHKDYTERVLTPDFMPGPVMRRCYEKPLGYPGDYQIMNYVYEWQRAGDTPYEKLLHRIGIVTGECVGTRLRMTKELISQRVAAHPGDEPMRIANLGCGSAYELYEYLQIDHLPRPLECTLIDQDHRALSCAYEQAYPSVSRHKGRVKIQCLETSFAKLLKAGELFKSMPPQDMIYSLGLFDYLSARRAKALTRDLYEQVVPGGQLIIANVKTGRETCMWPLEFVTDWSLVYRTEGDMRAMAEGLDIAGLTIAEDPTKCVYVMVIDKPA